MNSSLANDQEMQKNDMAKKERMKTYADNKAKSKLHSFQTRDIVLVKQAKQNKFTPPYDSKPYKIVSIKETLVTASCTAPISHTISQNVSYFNKCEIGILSEYRYIY